MLSNTGFHQDIVMPKMNGISATNVIRQFNDITPIISMTSNSSKKDVENYMANGMFVRFNQKPAKRLMSARYE